ncbi:hypothetical protein J3R82DRAFT_3309 [Butyriboletus roseoflavus]|nr:hypothetical protein J3R82DRAFT_3309 [Butyriboletus roseoflavus]
MPSPPFPPRPVPLSRQDDLDTGGRSQSRAPSNTPLRPYLPQTEAVRTPRSILRPTPLSHMSTPHDPTANPHISRPQPPPTASSPYHHHHTSSSPELRPRVDIAWAPRVRPYPQQYPSDLSQIGKTSSPIRPSSHIVPRVRGEQDDAIQRRSGFAARVNQQFVPGFRGRSASDVRIAHTPPPDLEPDRLARACGQPAPTGPYRHGDLGVPIDTSSSGFKDPGTSRSADASPSHPPVPKIKVGHMYRRLDTLARRTTHRAMDYLSFEDLAGIQRRDSQLREQLRRKRSERLQEKDPSFHAIGAPLQDVLLYASTPIVIGDYQHHLPIVVVACIEELTKTGIYQSGLFRALPSRDRHLQLIDLFDKSPDFGAQFNMRGQAMPDICALLSTFISSLPIPLLDAHIYSALWHWSVKPSVKREDARRDQQEEEEEERRARGEPPRPEVWMAHTDLYLDDTDSALETDQLSTAQILLRFLPTANLSLLVYLCAFFTQLPLCPENGLQLEDVARIFGHRLLGGSVKVMSQRMMMWMLTRWHRISDTLFGEMCGMTPPPSPVPHAGGSAIGDEGNRERVEKRKGKREGGSGDVIRHTTSTSSSYSSPSTESPEDRGVSSRKSSPDGEEGESSDESRRRKKRELDVQEPRTRQSSTRKESRHGHGQARRGSGSRRHHHHGHSSEHKNASASPDPFAMAFAKAQQDLVDAPLPTTPSSTIASDERDTEKRGSTSQIETFIDTPVRIAPFGNDSTRTDVDTHVVDALLQETAVATDAARALAERVEVLERALQVREGGEGQPQYPVVPRRGDEGQGDGEGEDDKGNGDKVVEDELRLQLRLVEAERDQAQQIVRDMRAYLLNEGRSTLH